MFYLFIKKRGCKFFSLVNKYDGLKLAIDGLSRADKYDIGYVVDEAGTVEAFKGYLADKVTVYQVGG